MNLFLLPLDLDRFGSLALAGNLSRRRITQRYLVLNLASRSHKNTYLQWKSRQQHFFLSRISLYQTKIFITSENLYIIKCILLLSLLWVFVVRTNEKRARILSLSWHRKESINLFCSFHFRI